MKYLYETFGTSKPREIEAASDEDALQQIRNMQDGTLQDVILVYVEQPEYRTVWSE